jgi:N-acyl-D-amino-acid deacylase
MAIELIKKGQPGIVSFNMRDDDVHRFMRQPWTMTSSDGGLVPMGSGVPHPRNYGAFPRKIRKFVNEEKVVSLSSAIRSMTTLPARVFGLAGRGQIRAGAIADIAIFDINRISDKATFQDPHQYSEGVAYVLVNGQFAVRDGQLSPQKAGQVLRHEPQ